MKTIPSPHKKRSGIALVMTVIILALITIMVLGFADLVRYETVSAATHQDRGRAQFLSQMGVDTVVGVLKKQTADPNLIWASKPGALIVPGDPASPKHLSAQVNLHSGYPTDPAAVYSDSVLAPANLNIQTLADQNPPSHLITDQSPDPELSTTGAIALPLRWVYVREDGTLDYAESPALGTANPLVGRYAYWTDDESSKININTAWKRNPPSTGPSSPHYNSFSPSHPTGVTLTSLNDPARGVSFSMEMANTLHSYITSNHTYTDLGVPANGNPHRFFNSIFEGRKLDALIESGTIPSPTGYTADGFTRALNAYKFELTHYNQDPDSTFFNEPRIVLTTQRKYAQGRPFIDILKDAGRRPQPGSGAGTLTDLGGDPGRTDKESINYTKLNDTVKRLVNYMKREDWPMVKGSGGKPSLQKKYYGDSDIRLTQIALNLIDYVRSAESEYLLVEPLRGIMEGGIFVSDIEDGGIRGANFTYKGITRSLYITEMGVWVAPEPETSGPNVGRFHCKFFVEVHLPEGNGIDELNLTALPLKYNQPTPTTNLWVYNNLISSGATTGTPAVQVYQMVNGEAGGKWWLLRDQNIVGDPNDDSRIYIRKGGYKTLQFDAWRIPTTITATNPNGRPTTFNNMRFALAMNKYKIDSTTKAITVTPPTAAQMTNGFGPDPGTQRFEVSPISGGSITYTADGPGVQEGDIRSMAVDDPFINNVSRDWKLSAPRSTFAGLKGGVSRGNPGGTRPLGPPNSDVSSLGKAPSADPPQDTDRDGKVTAASMRFPFPKGHEKNPYGMVYSAGELGFLHTGVEVDDKAPNGGVPFRTLRFQPSNHGNNTVPDWAFMDLFTAPAVSPNQAQDVFTPHGTGVGGRVNINALVEPYADPTVVTNEASRLMRRLPLVAVFTGAPSSTNSPDILDSTKARQIANNVYNRRWKSADRFGHPDAFDSPGEIVEIEGVADQGEESEAVVRSIGSLITTRGSVFSVYSIGQALRETRNGNLLVTAEQRNQTSLERYLEIDDQDTPDNYDDDIKTVHFRKVSSRNLTP
jgi:hypothetical protein